MDTYTFDLLIDNKTKELMEIYEGKVSNASTKKNKKLTTDPTVLDLDFNSKKLIGQINAAFDKKLKNSKAYKKKCEDELSNSAPH
jgi:hypothetical protein